MDGALPDIALLKTDTNRFIFGFASKTENFIRVEFGYSKPVFHLPGFVSFLFEVSVVFYRSFEELLVGRSSVATIVEFFRIRTFILQMSVTGDGGNFSGNKERASGNSPAVVTIFHFGQF